MNKTLLTLSLTAAALLVGCASDDKSTGKPAANVAATKAAPAAPGAPKEARGSRARVSRVFFMGVRVW